MKKHKVLNDGFRVYELWMDMSLFLVLYILCWFLIMIGLTTVIFYLINVWVSILFFIIISISFLIVSIKIFKSIIKTVVAGLKEYYNLLYPDRISNLNKERSKI